MGGERLESAKLGGLGVPGDRAPVVVDGAGRIHTARTTWDPETGAQDVGILKRVQREFDGTFALNAWAARAGRIALGDTVTLLDTFTTPALARPGRYV